MMAPVLSYSILVNAIFQKTGSFYHSEASEFIVWAPSRKSVELILISPASAVHPMEKDEWGYWKITIPAVAGTRYFFRLDDQGDHPDPASISQPDGVHGASELLDRNNFVWDDELWVGLPLSSMIIYELHTGAFSGSHDFDGIIRKLDYLAELGINTIELMPLGQFPGDRNWGYDGAYPFAVQDSYGGVRGLKQLVNAAHGKGIAVLVDVVYNHLGPEGNYLAEYGPYFTDKYHTPWGKPLNFDDAWCDGVRNYFVQNACMWLEDFHVDGLRLDAVHAIWDFSAIHFMRQLKEAVMAIEIKTARKKELIAEIDLNDVRYINPIEKGGYALDGQWSDEFHHALHSQLTGETYGYYSDFGEIKQLKKALSQTFVYNGNYSPHRRKFFGSRVESHPYSQFVTFAQNHDQVGNRPLGERLTSLVSFEQLKLAAATVLLSPHIPLLFMGEEYGEKNPFLYFTSHTDIALGEAIRRGRQEEFSYFESPEKVADPQDPATFQRSVLSWNKGSGSSAVLLRYYRHLIALRKNRPALQGSSRDSMQVEEPVGKVIAFQRKISNDLVLIWLNFGGETAWCENSTGDTLLKLFDSSAMEWLGPGADTGWKIAPGGRIQLPPWTALVFERKS